MAGKAVWAEHRIKRSIGCLWAALLLALGGAASPALTQNRTALVLEVEGAIGPATAA